jgi:uncharacterized repeat protein (TIGR03803 family)
MGNRPNLAKQTILLATAAIVASTSLALANPTLTTLVEFNDTDGAYPQNTLLIDSSGNLYGTTEGGGSKLDGTLFELAKGNNSVTTLVTFNGQNGSEPNGIVADASGDFYGTTPYSGSGSSTGNVFELRKGQKDVGNIIFFNQTTAPFSYSAPVLDASGKIYGTTITGGTNNDGVIFTVNRSNDTMIVLANLSVSSGYELDSAMIMDSSGNLFGTGDEGGKFGDGAVIELPKGSQTITTLASFDGNNGEFPFGGLVEDASGNLYGTTSSGEGSSLYGTIFEILKGSSTITTLANFDKTDGSSPCDTLIFDAAGDLFGTTRDGGTDDLGTVFELPHGSNTIIDLANFDGTDGATLFDSLVADSNGNLYGTTAFGGIGYQTQQPSGFGTIFELSGSGFVVPEPSSIALFLVAGFALTTRRRGRNSIYVTSK